MKKPTNPQEIIFSPQQSSSLAVQSIENRRDQKNRGIRSEIPGVDDILLPMKKGELIVVIGYTSNYKSGLMSFMAKTAINQIKSDQNDVIVYLSWEQSVEEQTLLDIAYTSQIDASSLYKGDLSEDQWKLMIKASMERASKPLWLIGHSEGSNSRRPRLNMSDVGIALSYLVDSQERKPRMIILDYLQRINRDDCGSSDMRAGFVEIVDRAKDMALAFGCPVILGTQAKREVLDRKWKLPTLADGQETSNLEQSADKILSVWMPKTSEPIGTNIRYGTTGGFFVSENLLLLQLLKQKYGKAPHLWALHVKPEINQIFPINRSEIGQN